MSLCRKSGRLGYFVLGLNMAKVWQFYYWLYEEGMRCFRKKNGTTQSHGTKKYKTPQKTYAQCLRYEVHPQGPEISCICWNMHVEILPCLAVIMPNFCCVRVTAPGWDWTEKSKKKRHALSSHHSISLLFRILSFCSGWPLTNAHRFAIYAICTVCKDLWRNSSYPVSHGGRYEASLCTLRSPQSPHSSRKGLMGFIALEDVILSWGASDH